MLISLWALASAGGALPKALERGGDGFVYLIGWKLSALPLHRGAWKVQFCPTVEWSAVSRGIAAQF